jgi:hypothetical protein
MRLRIARICVCFGPPLACAQPPVNDALCARKRCACRCRAPTGPANRSNSCRMQLILIVGGAGWIPPTVHGKAYGIEESACRCRSSAAELVRQEGVRPGASGEPDAAPRATLFSEDGQWRTGFRSLAAQSIGGSRGGEFNRDDGPELLGMTERHLPEKRITRRVGCAPVLRSMVSDRQLQSVNIPSSVVPTVPAGKRAEE